ncbi:hypothetical protein HPP92_011636 [Vanilla planifolia]|uniref:WRKY domain-containing protein n=1 Tax=Vanilla planifolia TaxID=51239 RepID=A0A835QZG5_VANPL|nr:hypothetical protein HPP92_011636 [Vanilla planifolia]
MGSANYDSSINLNLSIGSLQGSDILRIKQLHDATQQSFHDAAKLQKADRSTEEMRLAVEENGRLKRMLAIIRERHCALRAQVLRLMRSSAASSSTSMRTSNRKIGKQEINGSRRVSNRQVVEDSRPRIVKIYVRDGDLVMRDGYYWRKYGQKVIRDNPYPRAYFRCSFAPLCPVKKKVQRSAEDKSVHVVIYEGEHNHVQPSPGKPLNYMT